MTVAGDNPMNDRLFFLPLYLPSVADEPWDDDYADQCADELVAMMNEVREANGGPAGPITVCGVPGPSFVDRERLQRLLKLSRSDSLHDDIAMVLTVYDEHVAVENRGPWRDRLAELIGYGQ